MTRLTVIYTQTINQIAHHRTTMDINRILIITIYILLNGCAIEGEIFPWYDTEGNSGVTNEIKL
jgi:hypothetical protein